MTKTIELNSGFKRALSRIEEGAHVFVTGKAGTGKSTLLTYLRDTTAKNLVVLAPTGVAAVNVRGQTIHSFFGFRPDITVDKVRKKYKSIRGAELYKKLETIVIDEISMVRADLLDCVDTFLRMHGPHKNMPFGGVQMILIGDLYQLPPVVTSDEREIFSTHYQSPYFFDARGFGELALEIVELEKIYRQKDEAFIRILNAVRNRSIDEELLLLLNKRVIPAFKPQDGVFYVHLVTTNAKAGEINLVKLSALGGKKYQFDGTVTGDFEKGALPAPLSLELKAGSQIMLVNNDREGRWVNGTVGTIEKIEDTDDGDVVWVQLDNGETVDVTPYTWEMFHFSYNTKSQRIDSERIGAYTQYPIILAWAITIHKSQGKTFERVVVDLDRGVFAHGQTYVALSRATSLEGLVLTQPVEKRHVLLDFRVVRFLTQFQYGKSEALMPIDKKIEMINDAIRQKMVLEMVYLKSNDEKSRRAIRPTRVGEMEYLGKKFIGVVGFDELRGEERVFKVERILELGTERGTE